MGIFSTPAIILTVPYALLNAGLARCYDMTCTGLVSVSEHSIRFVNWEYHNEYVWIRENCILKNTVYEESFSPHCKNFDHLNSNVKSNINSSHWIPSLSFVSTNFNRTVNTVHTEMTKMKCMHNVIQRFPEQPFSALFFFFADWNSI